MVMILRNPIERAFSHFLTDCRIGRVNAPFGRSWSSISAMPAGWAAAMNESYIEIGMYAEQIQPRHGGKEPVAAPGTAAIVRDPRAGISPEGNRISWPRPVATRIGRDLDHGRRELSGLRMVG
jgi:hypothetical protein